MDGLIVLGVLAFVGWYLYKAGKRKGSMAGFNAGRRRARRKK